MASSHGETDADADMNVHTRSNGNENGDHGLHEKDNDNDGLFDEYSYTGTDDAATEEDLQMPPVLDPKGGNDFYAILASPRDATPSQLKASYRHLSLFFHPDKQPDHLRALATKKFNLVKKAYETLMDPNKRAVYDRLGEAGLEMRELGPRGMSPEEFRLFIDKKIQTAQREKLERMVGSQGLVMIGVDATSLFSPDDVREADQSGIKASKFFIQNGFHLPMHWLSTVINTNLSPAGLTRLWKGDLDEDEDERQQHQRPPLLRLSGQLGGSTVMALQQDAQGRSRKIANSPVLATAGITMSLSHAFPLLPPPNPGRAGEISIGRVLQGSQVAITHSLFGRSTTTAYSKPILSNTVGMNLVLQMSHGSTYRMPTLDATFSRQVSKKGVFVAQFGTGYQWSIPLPFGIKWLTSSRNLPGNPSASIGWTMAKSRGVNDDDDDAEEEEASDEEEQEGGKSSNGNKNTNSSQKKKKKKASGGKTSVAIFLSARKITQGLGILSTNIEIGRTFFSRRRRVGDSGPRPNSHRGIRLSARTALGLTPVNSFSLTFSATRPIGSTSRIGLELTLDPSSSPADGGGLVLSVLFRRLGQRVNVPVSITSFRSVEDLIERAVPLWLTTLVASAALWVGWEYYILRPIEARELRKLRQKRIRDNRKSRTRQKMEAEEAIQLMRDSVTRKMHREIECGGLVIINATYCGIVDVTVPVAGLVEQGQLFIPGRTRFGKMVGFWEPEDVPRGKRILQVYYYFNGVKHYAEVEDCKGGLVLPQRSHVGVPPHIKWLYPDLHGQPLNPAAT